MTPSPMPPATVIVPVYSPPIVTLIGQVTVQGLWSEQYATSRRWRAQRIEPVTWRTSGRRERVVWGEEK